MLNIFMANIFENNSQLGPIVFWLAIIVVIGLIIATVVIHIRDKRKEKIDDQLDTQWRAEQVVNRVEAISPKSGKKKIRQIKRGSRDPKKIEEEQAASKNTLLGGKSEAQMEEKESMTTGTFRTMRSLKSTITDNRGGNEIIRTCQDRQPV